MRNAFISELTNAARSNLKIVLVIGDLGYGVVEPFANEFPDRFFNAGVAEQNMVGLAAGLASEGFHVFCYSIANFPTFRCAEQIRNDVDYHNLAVTIVAVGGGLSYGNLGYSHHAIQDYALMRAMPNMLIAAPGDPMEVKACMRYLIENPQPSYLRLGKAGEKSIHLSVPEVAPGKPTLVRAGKSKDKVFISTGSPLASVNDFLSESSIAKEISQLSMPLWGMGSKSRAANELATFNKVITVEDHLEDGGFGSWILESVNKIQNNKPTIVINSLDSKVCGMVGTQAVLNDAAGMLNFKKCV
jgi:transketolase